MKVIFPIIFFSFILLPHVHQKILKLKPYGLGGYEEKVKKPKISFKDFIEGNYQEQVSKYIYQKLGLRSYFIRTDNQLSVFGFGQISPKTSSQVIIGKDKTLFEAPYIFSNNHKYEYDINRIAHIAEQTKQLQSYLEKHNKHFLLLISPNKVDFHDKELPKRYLIKDKKLEDTLSIYKKTFSTKNINFLDAKDFFIEKRNEIGTPIFSNTGTHWSFYPACLFLNKAIENIENMSKEDLVDLDCGKPTVESAPKGTDKDLLYLLNVWTPKRFYKKNYYSTIKSTKKPNYYKPRVLIIGDSFTWQTLHITNKHNVFSQRDFFYYFDVNHKKRGVFKQGKINRNNIDLISLINKKDLVLLEINEGNLKTGAFGFLDEIIKQINSAR